VNDKVFTLPGPFDARRIVEFEGPFRSPEHLFPDATPDQVAASAICRNPRFFDQHANLLVMSFHSILLHAAGKTILVDACLGNDKPRPHVEEWDMRQGTFLEDLKQAGTSVEDVDIVMCTHLHADHVGWNTRLDNGQWVPTFPNARYLFARKEMAYWQQQLADRPATEVNHDSWADSVVPVIDAGLAVQVAETEVIAPGVSLLPAPGHTPGNVILRLEDQGERAYVTGDSIHHPVQVDHPEWSSRFCWDPDLSRDTRRSILDMAADEKAWLLPAHFPTPTAAQIRRTSTGYSLRQPDSAR
jgi:glyoxylase-like metal-dependent hydrolase (beta-lactamase superfamily II)